MDAGNVTASVTGELMDRAGRRGPRRAPERTSFDATERLLRGRRYRGARRNPAAAVSIDGRLEAFCEQGRLTRIRRAALTPGELPAEAVDAVLRSRWRVAGGGDVLRDQNWRRSCPAICRTSVSIIISPTLPRRSASPLDDAAVLVCDEHSTPQVSVWQGHGGRLHNANWPWAGDAFAAIYSQCATLFGLGAGQEHRLEALARLLWAAPVSRTRGLFPVCRWPTARGP